METLNGIITDHPGAVVLVFTALWAMVVIQAQFIFNVGKRELTRIWDSEKAQNGRLSKIEEEIHGEETDVRQIRNRLEEHVEKEERVWEDIRIIGHKVNDIQRKLPNGDLKLALAKLDMVAEKLTEVAGDVKGHNSEAEGWKRKIERNEVRLDNLEKK